MNPIVSVIVPTRNRAKLLSRAINSILTQTFKDFEIIIIDGNSTDDTQQVVEGYLDPRIRYYLQEVPKNGAQATNEGIAKAKGKYIAFLDDDDEWLPEKLAKQVSLLESLPDEYGMVYCWMDYFNSEGQIIHQTHPSIKGNIFEKVLLTESIGGTPTYLIRKAVIDRVGGFDTNLVFGDDGEFIRRIAKYYKVEFVPEVLAKVYIDHGFKRQSDMDPATYREAINSRLYLLEKYKQDFDQIPGTKSVIYALIAVYFTKLKEPVNFFRYAVRSTFTSFLPVGKYKMLAKSFLNLIK
jgi:glycosyltransferase involved in cell wall biosynthesis